jgi:hypothetical protein
LLTPDCFGCMTSGQSTEGTQAQHARWRVFNLCPAAVFDMRYELWLEGVAITLAHAVEGSGDDVVLPGMSEGRSGPGDHEVRPTISA